MKKIFVILLAMLLLSGCTSNTQMETNRLPTNEPTMSKASGDEIEVSEDGHIQQSLGQSIDIDAEVQIPSVSDVSVIDVELITFDNDKVIQVFFDGNITSEEDVAGGQRLITGTDKSCCYYTNNMNCGLFLQTDAVDCVFNVVRWQNEEFGNLSHFSDEDALDFSSREDAAATVKEVLNNLGIQNTGEMSIYALDYQTLAAEEKWMQDSGGYEGYSFKENWSKDDECYFITMDCVINGVPVSNVDTTSMYEEMTISGSRIVAVYSKTGFLYFEIGNLYTQKGTGNSTEIVSAEDAIRMMGNKFDSIITSNKYTITNVSLKYIPQFKDKTYSSIQLVPAWYFTVKETYVSDKDNVAQEVIHNYMIDAISGNEM